MSTIQLDPLKQAETTCGTLLYELQIIWDEVGETDTDRDKMLFELEQECLEVYRRKVDQANRCRAQLRQAIADSEAELAAICSAMGERPVHIRQSDQAIGSLKDELKKILPQLEEMKKRKSERRNQFLEVLEEIRIVSNEILGPTGYSSSTAIDDTDLSMRKLEELHKQLHALQMEKNERLKRVQDHLCVLSSLCAVLGVDFKQTINEIHPGLGDSGGSNCINNEIIELLASGIKRLREVKVQRMQRLQDLATTLLTLWDLMDTPVEEQQMFQKVTCNIAASEEEITEPNTLSVDFINYIEAEVSRLEELKASKMKELVFKKRSELEEICRKTHMILEADSALDCAIEAVESGAIDPSCILEQIELQVGKVKEEAFSRKEILERVEKWLLACDEECWLEEYNRDDNRYNAGKGAHLTLKRAEKARALVNKLPAMVDALASKTVAWEREKGSEFTYDGIRLLSMLEEYNILRQEKEQERRRQRDQKKLQGQIIAEQEALYGSKPSPSKPSAKKGPRMSTGGASNRRLSLGGAMIQTPKPDHFKTSRPSSRKSDRSHQNEMFTNRLDDPVAALATARRGLDVAGVPIRNHSFNARDFESPMKRKPFSPISTPVQAKTNATKNLSDDTNAAANKETEQKNLPSSIHMPFATPSKPTSAITTVEEENKTPRFPISVPTTPFTVTVPMQTAMTPGHQLIPFASNKAEEVKVPEEIEYSFEERRAGYVVSKSHLKSMIQV